MKYTGIVCLDINTQVMRNEQHIPYVVSRKMPIFVGCNILRNIVRPICLAN